LLVLAQAHKTSADASELWSKVKRIGRLR
jgi:hypothetical protein